MSEFYISHVAELTGLGVETIRYYEKAGVVQAPPRGQNGYRLYGQDGVRRLLFVKKCRDLGFSLKRTRSLLGLTDAEDRTCAQVRSVAHNRLEEVRRKIIDLHRMETALLDLVDDCPGDSTSDCPILAALAEEA